MVDMFEAQPKGNIHAVTWQLCQELMVCYSDKKACVEGIPSESSNIDHVLTQYFNYATHLSLASLVMLVHRPEINTCTTPTTAQS